MAGQRWGVPAGAPGKVTVHVKNGWLPYPVHWHINSIGRLHRARHHLPDRHADHRQPEHVLRDRHDPGGLRSTSTGTWRRSDRAAAPFRDASAGAFPDWRYAPNITGHPRVYEIENRALDQAGHVLDARGALAPWAGKTIVDLGCGTGFWLARYAEQAGRVIGIEPRRPARPGRAGRGRTGGSGPAIEVRAGSAEHTGLPGGCADVVHARFAYFFPPGTDAGLTEVLRVLRPGGQLIAVDNDYRWGEFSALLAAGIDPAARARSPRRWTTGGGPAARPAHEVRSELQLRHPRRPGRRPAHRASRPRWPAAGSLAIRWPPA